MDRATKKFYEAMEDVLLNLILDAYDYKRYRRAKIKGLIPPFDILIELLIPKGRMCFFDENIEAKNNPNFQSIYVCSGILDNQIEFTNMER